MPQEKKRKYWTPCDKSAYGRCNEVAKLDMPAKWRCDKCTKEWGPLPKPDPKPTP